jgi:hypothetical protein
MTKTFKIGEYAVGGIVRIDTDNNANIRVRCLDWHSKKTVLDETFKFVDKFKLQMYLEDEVTSCFYADKIMKSIYA